MASLDELGELQRAVMEKIWELGEATVQQVREQLGRDPQPAYTTILTVMQKLEQAGWLSHKNDGKAYIYVPTRTRREAGTASIRQFMRRVFAGDSKALFQHLLEDENLTPEELAEFRKMIDRRRKGQHHG